jgi:hypothetical protein
MDDKRLKGPVVEFPASETLGGHRAIAIVDGTAVHANQAEPDRRLVRGISRGAVAIGSVARIQVLGPMREASWNWTPGQPIFATGDGVLTQTVPTSGVLQQLAIADSPTQIFIDVHPPIVLSS